MPFVAKYLHYNESFHIELLSVTTLDLCLDFNVCFICVCLILSFANQLGKLKQTSLATGNHQISYNSVHKDNDHPRELMARLILFNTGFHI